MFCGFGVLNPAVALLPHQSLLGDLLLLNTCITCLAPVPRSAVEIRGSALQENATAEMAPEVPGE